MISLNGCQQHIHALPALHQHGMAETLQSSLQTLKPHVDVVASMVERLSHLTPPDVLCHAWPAYLRVLPLDMSLQQWCEAGQQA